MYVPEKKLVIGCLWFFQCSLFTFIRSACRGSELLSLCLVKWRYIEFTESRVSRKRQLVLAIVIVLLGIG